MYCFNSSSIVSVSSFSQFSTFSLVTVSPPQKSIPLKCILKTKLQSGFFIFSNLAPYWNQGVIFEKKYSPNFSSVSFHNHKISTSSQSIFTSICGSCSETSGADNEHQGFRQIHSFLKLKYS